VKKSSTTKAGGELSLGPLFDQSHPISMATETDASPMEKTSAPIHIPSQETQKKNFNRIWTVTELSAELRETLNEEFPQVTLRAEIADFKGIHRSGHLYFALKDENAQIRAVMWRGAVGKVPFEIKAGLEIIVTGKLDYYGGSGSLQIVVEKMEPVGIGALQLKFEQLKAKLQAEGLFDNKRKRIIENLNWRIGLVTGKSTAALQDMLKIFRHRFPLAEIFLFFDRCSKSKPSRK
jgi:exodeoxyribonuclease VII large subunit